MALHAQTPEGQIDTLGLHVVNMEKALDNSTE